MSLFFGGRWAILRWEILRVFKVQGFTINMSAAEIGILGGDG